ncbi:MAG: hypothetical protein ACK47B_22525 [Armatimonadota bacterium]
MATGSRRTPLLSIRLYDVAEGDPRVVTSGFAWCDILAESCRYGSSDFDTAGRPRLEYLPEIGLTCRARLALQDTRASQYRVAGGAWEERRPALGSPRVYRLVQYDASPGVEWSATSLFDLPEDPDCAVELLLPHPPPDWDAAALPPYVQVELGGGAWAIRYDEEGGFLLRRAGSAWQLAAELPRPARSGGFDPSPETVVLFVRCLRGQVGVSVDGGRRYTWSGYPDGVPVSIPAGSVAVRGRGGVSLFGLHQLAYSSGVYTSPERNTLTARAAVVPVLEARSDAPGATTIGLGDLSTPAAGIARYAVTLTPESRAAVPFPVQRAPVVYAVQLRYAPEVQPGTGAYTTPWDERLRWCEVDEPLELHAGSAAWQIRLPPGESFSGEYRRRKVQIRMGWREDGEEQWWTVFTGYIDRVRIEADGYGASRVTFRAENATARFKHSEWTMLEARPLGGLTLNAAADAVLASEGLNASYRLWDGLGDRFALPPGSPEEPAELPRPGERKWETLERIFGYAHLEPYARRDGTISSVPRSYFGPVTRSYRVTDPAAAQELIDSLSVELDYNRWATAVLVTGRGERGGAMVGWARDGAAEGGEASAHFCPWREVLQEEIPGSTSPGLVLSRAQALAYDLFGVRSETEVALPLDPGVERRDAVALYGAGAAGFADGAELVVLTLRHRVDLDPESGHGPETIAGLRRLAP